MKPLMKDETPIHILWLPTILALGIAYVVSWVDLLPDAFLGVGWIDDIVVVIAVVWFFTSWLPKNKHRIYWFSPRGKTGGQDRRESGQATSREAGTKLDPFDVLDVRRGASASEIKQAYRQKLSKYHPDKVNHLGHEFQEIAHQKVIEIQKAYEMLCGKG